MVPDRAGIIEDPSLIHRYSDGRGGLPGRQGFGIIAAERTAAEGGSLDHIVCAAPVIEYLHGRLKQLAYGLRKERSAVHFWCLADRCCKLCTEFAAAGCIPKVDVKAAKSCVQGKYLLSSLARAWPRFLSLGCKS